MRRASLTAQAGTGKTPSPSPDNLSLPTLPPPDQIRGRLYSPEPCVAKKQSPGLFSERSSPVENVRACLPANRPAFTVFDTHDDIVEACWQAWNFFANDPVATASITSRVWAQVR